MFFIFLFSGNLFQFLCGPLLVRARINALGDFIDFLSFVLEAVEVVEAGEHVFAERGAGEGDRATS